MKQEQIRKIIKDEIFADKIDERIKNTDKTIHRREGFLLGFVVGYVIGFELMLLWLILFLALN